MAYEVEISLAILTGPVSAAIGSYIAYKFAVRQNKQDVMLPYFRELHGIVHRILRKRDAKNLNEAFNSASKPQITFEEITKKQKVDEDIPDSLYHFLSYLSENMGLLLFRMAYNDLVEIIQECHNFERVYSEMDQKGLIAILEKRQQTLSNFLTSFNSSAHDIVTNTNVVFEKLQQDDASIIGDFLKPGSEAHDHILPKLGNISTHNLFVFGAGLEKQLEKVVT